MSFGSRLKEARKKSGLTQAEVAEKLNVSASMIAQYETGKRNPKKETLSKIANILNLGFTFAENGSAYFYDFVDAIDNPDYAENQRFNNFQYKDALSETSHQKHSGNMEVNSIDLSKENNIFLNTMAELNKKLNSSGQSKAIEQVELLTKIPEYRKEDAPDPEE